MFHFFQVSCLPTLVHKMFSCRYCRIQKHAQHFCSKYWRDSETVGGSRTHRNRLAPSTGGIQYTAESFPRTESLSPKYWQFRNAIIAMPAMRFPSTSKPRRNRFHPSTGIFRSVLMGSNSEALRVREKNGHFQNPPYCIQNPENALPQVLTGFRNNQRHGGIAFPQTTPTMLCPKYWRDSEINQRHGGIASPKYWRFLDPP